MKPLHMLSDSSIRTMIVEFSKKAWQKNERDAVFARESTQRLQEELARRAGTR